MDRAANFLVAANDGIEFAFGGGGSEIARVLLQAVVGIFRSRRVGGAALADVIYGGVERLRRHARGFEQRGSRRRRLQRERQQQPFDGDEVIARFLRHLLGLIEDLAEFGRHVDLARAAAGDLRAFGDQPLIGGVSFGPTAARALNQARGEAFGIVEQHFEQVIGAHLLMALALRKGLR